MVRVSSSHLSQKKRSEMETEAAPPVVLGTLVGKFGRSDCSSIESGLPEPQPTHIPPLHLQVMREPNYYLLPALTPETQQAADGTLARSLGASGRYSEETGKELWRPQGRFRSAFYGAWRTTGSRTKQSQNHRLLKLLASHMDSQNLSITISSSQTSETISSNLS